MTREPVWLRAAATGVCAYEAAALWSNRLPTITRVVHQHPWLVVPILGGLALHFHPKGVR